MLKSINSTSILFIIYLSSIFNASAQWSEWKAPKEASDTLVNIFEHNDKSAIAEGQALYASICFLCHGDMGKGDGIQAAALARPPADLTSNKVQQQTDGELFWKITNGNDLMLSFGYYTEEQRWQLVNYLRELAKLNPPPKEIVESVKEDSLFPFDLSNSQDLIMIVILSISGVVLIILFLTLSLFRTVMKIIKPNS